jgi:hypothetical protein
LSPTWQVDTAERYTAYRERMEQLGLTAGPLMGADLPAELSMDQQGYLAAQQFVADPPPCTAVLVGTDLIALGFIRGLQEAEIMVPTDLAVIGIDDVDEAAVSVPPLATVAISFERVGEIAFNAALQGGRGEAVETQYLVPQLLVPRDSCGCVNSTRAEPAGDVASQTGIFRHALAEAARDGAPRAEHLARLGLHGPPGLRGPVRNPREPPGRPIPASSVRPCPTMLRAIAGIRSASCSAGPRPRPAGDGRAVDDATTIAGLLDEEVDGIITDRPDVLREVLIARNASTVPTRTTEISSDEQIERRATIKSRGLGAYRLT